MSIEAEWDSFESMCWWLRLDWPPVVVVPAAALISLGISAAVAALALSALISPRWSDELLTALRCLAVALRFLGPRFLGCGAVLV